MNCLKEAFKKIPNLTVLFSKAKSCLTDPPMIDVPGRSDSASRSMAE